jgi:hypothetical protein
MLYDFFNILSQHLPGMTKGNLEKKKKIMTPRSLVDVYQHFDTMCCLHLPAIRDPEIDAAIFSNTQDESQVTVHQHYK